jgi:hypothetical protein
MKQTAVEWLKQNLPSLFVDDSGHYAELFEQAKEIEKQQIIDAVNSQRQLGWDEKGEQYYNKTYKKPLK